VRSPGPLAWAGATAFAIMLEGVKLMIVGRAPNVDTVLLAALGGLVGITVLPALGRIPAVCTHAPALLICGAMALLAYEELTPFIFGDSLSALRGRVPRIEWMPFAAYYGTDLQSALFEPAPTPILLHEMCTSPWGFAAVESHAMPARLVRYSWSPPCVP
jgi:hypothetical protein